MYYRLSNIAEREMLEKHFALPFKYPNLYKPRPVINGLKEETLSIITCEDPRAISLGIWGILPQRFQEDWQYFQSFTNTLHVNESILDSESWCKNALKHRRCLILVTGFFTACLREGVIYPYYVGRPSGAPFCMGGIYNYTADGFITCSFLTVKKNKFLHKVHNISQEMPLTLSGNLQRKWISPDIELEDITNIIRHPKYINLLANPLPADFYNKPNVIYELDSANLIEREYYKKTPNKGALRSWDFSNGDSP